MRKVIGIGGLVVGFCLGFVSAIYVARHADDWVYGAPVKVVLLKDLSLADSVGPQGGCPGRPHGGFKSGSTLVLRRHGPVSRVSVEMSIDEDLAGVTRPAGAEETRNPSCLVSEMAATPTQSSSDVSSPH